MLLLCELRRDDVDSGGREGGRHLRDCVKPELRLELLPEELLARGLPGAGPPCHADPEKVDFVASLWVLVASESS